MAIEMKTMEIKKTEQLSKPILAKDTSVPTGQWKNSLGDIKAEFLKINWTSPEELKNYTKIVIGMTFFMGMGIYLMDIGIQLVLGALEYVMRLIG